MTRRYGWTFLLAGGLAVAAVGCGGSSKPQYEAKTPATLTERPVPPPGGGGKAPQNKPKAYD
jgi:hypothetical protein